MRTKWLVAGGLVLALVVLCAGIMAVSWFSIARLSRTGVNWRVFSADIVSAEADEEQRFAMSGPAVLSVENGAGDVTVTGGEGAEIVVAAHKTAWGPTQAQAEAVVAVGGHRPQAQVSAAEGNDPRLGRGARGDREPVRPGPGAGIC